MLLYVVVHMDDVVEAVAPQPCRQAGHGHQGADLVEDVFVRLLGQVVLFWRVRVREELTDATGLAAGPEFGARVLATRVGHKATDACIGDLVGQRRCELVKVMYRFVFLLEEATEDEPLVDKHAGKLLLVDRRRLD